MFSKDIQKLREGITENLAIPARQAQVMAGIGLIIAVVALIVALTGKAS